MSANNFLDELIAVEKDARQFGFEWPDNTMIIKQAISECEEIQEALDHNESKQRVQEEIGDLLHTAISLCLFNGFDVNETLAKVAEKFARRMQGIKQLTQQRGLDNLAGQHVDFMLELWREVKERELK